MPLDLLGSDKLFLVHLRDVPLEVGLIRHLGELRLGLWVSQQILREEENKGLAEVTVNLATEDMEVVGGGRRVDNLHIAVLMLALNFLGGGELVGMVITQLEESLNSTGRVLRAYCVVEGRHYVGA